MQPATATSWASLPTEMKFAIVELLQVHDVRAFARVDKDAYSLAVPAMWRVRPLSQHPVHLPY